MEEEQLDEMYKNSQLGPDYVFNYMFEKLADTLEKYRDILPPIDDLEQEICSIEHGDEFEITMSVLGLLKSRSEDSPLIAEIFTHVSHDLWHGIDPKKYKKHEGKYYIDSVAD